MDECVEEFKLELEKLYEEMYERLDDLICNALVVMSFFNDGEENYEILQKVVISVAQEQIASPLYKNKRGLN